MGGTPELTGPDLAAGVALADIPDGGMLGGHAHGAPVLVARRGNALFAIDAVCSHYGGPLAEGLMVGDTVRCPWHHACFDLRTGSAIRAPALKPLSRWQVDHRAGRVTVSRQIEGPAADPPIALDNALLDRRIVIVGAGAAGDAAADMLRRHGHRGSIVLIGEDDAPCDRPNLSKDYLAGNAPEEWIPLRAPDFYDARDIRLVLGDRVTAIDRSQRRVTLASGASHAYDALLLATGASPIRLPDTVAGGPVHYLRTLADSRAIIAATTTATTAVVIGASFIGLEVAASLRARGLAVHVVAPEPRPLERVLGPALGDFIRTLHESHGVVFDLGRSVARVATDGVTLDDGVRLAADCIVAGIGVRPNDALAAAAGLAVNRGITVDAHLATNDPLIFAAGDVARYPDPRTGDAIRVEHWVAAQRQGQHAARTLLGAAQPFTDVPFFWSAHYDVTIAYVGHAERWDEIVVDGRAEDHDCTISYRLGGRTLATATIGRDHASLDAEVVMERESTR